MSKKEWTSKISELIANDSRSGVRGITYSKEERNGWIREIVRIDYNFRSHTEINVTGNSLGSILHEIVREVYGSGAIGRIGF